MTGTDDDDLDFLAGEPPPQPLGRSPQVVCLAAGILAQDPDLARAAVEAARQAGVTEVQLEVIARLRQGPAALGHEHVDRFLLYLQELADGRAVRDLEALLLERGAELTEAHAWRTRHIVQRIRRGGRR